MNWRPTEVLLSGLALVCGVQAAQVSAPTVYSGMSDASAAVALGTNLFAVADNELTRIHIYGRDKNGPPIRSIDMSRFLEVQPKRRQVDMEGCARIGNRVFWISSHGRNAEGKDSPNRQRFFATDIRESGAELDLVPAGRPCKDLLAALIVAPQLARFHLARASQKAPKKDDALNIEGMCATPEGRLLVGFRNPIPDDRALVVPLNNPDQVVEGKAASLGEPILLDLDGLGIRDMAQWDGKYLLIAGSSDGKGHSRLYWWPGPGAQPERIKGLKFKNLNPEALAIYPDEGLRRFQLFSDDGSVRTGGIPEKELAPNKREFRAVWVTP